MGVHEGGVGAVHQDHFRSIGQVPDSFHHGLESGLEDVDVVALERGPIMQLWKGGVAAQSLVALDDLLTKEEIDGHLRWEMFSWDGHIYDCDFNQMLEMPIGQRRADLWSIDNLEVLSNRPIALDDHCYGCTAGQGSSCRGALF